MRRSTRVKRSQRPAAAGGSRRLWIGGGIALGLVAFAGLLFLALRQPDAIAGLQQYLGLPRGHDESVTYQAGLPPAGGIHSGQWQNCGIYEEPVEAKNAVHSLEHGAVWLAYNPSLAAADVAALQQQVWDEPFVLMSPYPGLESAVVMTAWGVQVEIDSVPDARVDRFIERYQQGPQTPEPGASCADGLGQPINR